MSLALEVVKTQGDHYEQSQMNLVDVVLVAEGKLGEVDYYFQIQFLKQHSWVEDVEEGLMVTTVSPVQVLVRLNQQALQQSRFRVHLKYEEKGPLPTLELEFQFELWDLGRKHPKPKLGLGIVMLMMEAWY